MKVKSIALATAFISTLSLGVQAAERDLRYVTAECGFVIVNGQPMETRFPDAQQSGQATVFTATKKGVAVQIDTAATTCVTSDPTVAFENAETVVTEVADDIRLINIEKTSYGRMETAYRGYFNGSKPVLLVYTAHSAGGTEITMIVE